MQIDGWDISKFDIYIRCEGCPEDETGAIEVAIGPIQTPYCDPYKQLQEREARIWALAEESEGPGASPLQVAERASRIRQVMNALNDYLDRGKQ